MDRPGRNVREHTTAGWRALIASRWARALETAALALLAYVPFLLSSPGRVSSDTKTYLSLDPSRFLARAPYLWDAQVGAGTVPHQHLGYLFPMGPYYWLMEQLGVPDWVAQRLWLGSISLAAALGARWLLRMLGAGHAGALAGAVVYVMTPYQLAFTARMSVLLLAWAGLPWLVGLTMRAVDRGGWRDPAWFALVTLTIGSVNASSLVLVGLAPALWLVLHALRGTGPARAALGAATRILSLTVAVSVWWIAGLRLQGAYGMPVLQLTENLRTVAEWSSPDDVLRGLGNWFFYGRDRFGYSLDQTLDYLRSRATITATYALPVGALLAAGLTRWRHRAYFTLCIVGGTVVAVGAWPYDDTTPYGRVWKAFTDTSAGLALRNSARVVPVVVLGVAALLAAAVSAVRVPLARHAAAALVMVVALGALLPVWRTGYLSDGVSRPGEVPAYWHDAVAALDRDGRATRVLEMPGAPFAAYVWGNTVEPVTPGLTDRPYVAREVLPYGSPATANLLDALDRRLQNGTFEPEALAPLARLLGAGTVVARLDLDHERQGTPRPRLLWALLTDPPAPGVAAPRTFGALAPDDPRDGPVGLDELDLRASSASNGGDLPAVALFEVDGAEPIVRTRAATQPVLLVGDGDGIVDAAGAGLLDGHALVLSLGSLDRDDVDRALDAGADIVLTDSNRRRIEHWFYTIRGTQGATERAGRRLPDPSGYDFRLEPFDRGDDARTVVEHVGGRVDATADGGPPRPEDRAVHAFDGDVRTSWRVGGADPTGERITIVADAPVHGDEVTFVQPLDGPHDRRISRIRLRFDGGAPLDVDLGEESLTAGGQRVEFPERTFRRLEVEIAATTEPPFDAALANAVGFATIDVASLRVEETVRLPVDFAEQVGRAASGHSLDVVLTRLRGEPGERDRQDEELALDRRFVLPDDRRLAIGGTARVDPNAPGETIDEILGTQAGGAASFAASSHLAGDLDARASRAFDGDRATAWTSAIGDHEGAWLEVDLAAPRAYRGGRLEIVADGRHSVPSRLRVEADGVAVATVEVPDAALAGTTDGSVRVPLELPSGRARRLRVVVEAVHVLPARAGDPRSPGLPVSVAELALDGLPAAPAAPARVDTGCRTDLLEVDGEAVPVRVHGPAGAARRGLSLEGCGDRALSLDEGSHRLRARPGLDTGIDLDRIVLSSGAGGRAPAVAARGPGAKAGAPEIRVVGEGRTSFELEVRSDGRPFWLVLGQSHNDGWRAHAEGRSLGEPLVVDGYANGWLVTPEGAGTIAISLEWEPQRVVWVALALSAIAVAGCLVILVRPARRRGPGTLADAPEIASPVTNEGLPAPWRTAVVAGVTVAVVSAVFARPWIAAVAGAVTVVALRLPRGRVLVALGAPAALAASRLTRTPELAWLALALLGAQLATARRGEPRSGDEAAVERAPTGAATGAREVSG